MSAKPPAQNVNEALGVPPGATPERTVTGLSLLKGGLPHFDVEVSANTPLAEALASTFDLPDVLGVDPQALHQLQQQSDSQRETTKEQLESLFSPAELVAQTIAFKVQYIRPQYNGPNNSLQGTIYSAPMPVLTLKYKFLIEDDSYIQPYPVYGWLLQ